MDEKVIAHDFSGEACAGGFDGIALGEHDNNRSIRRRRLSSLYLSGCVRFQNKAFLSTQDAALIHVHLM